MQHSGVSGTAVSSRGLNVSGWHPNLEMTQRYLNASGTGEALGHQAAREENALRKGGVPTALEKRPSAPPPSISRDSSLGELLLARRSLQGDASL